VLIFKIQYGSRSRPCAALFSLAVVLLFSIEARATLTSPVYDSYSNSYLYLVGSTSDSWSQAQALAQAIGGNLITIHSAAEDQFVSNTFFANLTSQGGPNLSSAYGLWMGLYDPTGITSDDGSRHASDFTWVDGETSTYRDWAPYEPDDGNGGPHEYYGLMWGPDAVGMTGGASAPTGTWNDLGELYPGPLLPVQGFYAVAEVPVPEPSLIGVLAVAGILVSRRSKGAA
jgi:hypothetical protein